MPKMEVRPSGANKAKLTVSGAIDETFETSQVDLSPYSEIDIDLKEVSRMNSRGLRNWLRWISSLDRSKRYTLIACPHIIVSIAGLVADLFPKWMNIHSLEVPFVCETCGTTFSYMHTLQSQTEIPANLPRVHECPKCKAQADIGVSPEIYFRFLTGRK